MTTTFIFSRNGMNGTPKMTQVFEFRLAKCHSTRMILAKVIQEKRHAKNYESGRSANAAHEAQTDEFHLTSRISYRLGATAPPHGS